MISNVPEDRFLGVGWEAKNITGVRDGAVVAPFLEQLAVFGDLVLPFLGGNEIVGIDILKSNEHMARAGLRSFLYEIRNLVAERVDLNGKDEIRKFGLAQVDETIEQQFPVAIARKIVVGDMKQLMFCA